MALTYGSRWAIYLLLQTHSGTKGTKSQFRTTVEAYIAAGQTIQAAIAQAANEQIDNAIQPADIGQTQTLTANDLRPALGLDDTYYDPTQGPCPNGSEDGAGYKVDHQQAIIDALLEMTGPVPL